MSKIVPTEQWDLSKVFYIANPWLWNLRARSHLFVQPSVFPWKSHTSLHIVPIKKICSTTRQFYHIQIQSMHWCFALQEIFFFSFEVLGIEIWSLLWQELVLGQATPSIWLSSPVLYTARKVLSDKHRCTELCWWLTCRVRLFSSMDRVLDMQSLMMLSSCSPDSVCTKRSIIITSFGLKDLGMCQGGQEVLTI